MHMKVPAKRRTPTARAMIKKELATELLELTRCYCDNLNRSTQKFKDECSAEDFEWYRDGVGRMMAYSYEHIMGPLFKQHPDLEPEEWKGEDDEADEAGRGIATAVYARRSGDR
jgi:hypothetical protein